jgi:hypothetical protein
MASTPILIATYDTGRLRVVVLADDTGRVEVVRVDGAGAAEVRVEQIVAPDLVEA